MTKKAQAQMMETIVVLFIFFILLAFSAVFYVRYQKIAAQEQEGEVLVARALDTTLLVLFMPELTCTKGEAEVEDNCFDVLKLDYLNRLIMENKEYYFHQFSFAKITVDQIYPAGCRVDIGKGVSCPDDPAGKKRWTVYDQELKDGEEEPTWKNKEQTFFIVSLRDLSENKPEYTYGYGVLTVEVFS